MSNKQINITVFASGSGSNCEKFLENDFLQQRIQLIATNNAKAGVLNIAKAYQKPTLIINKEIFFKQHGYAEQLKQSNINLIILAGFLWKIPKVLIDAFADRIINIHPALLPKYGGKGMYGHFVHEAVINNKENETGITIHYVDELYDHGKTIFQAKCIVHKEDTAVTIAKKVQQLEHYYFGKIVETIVKELEANN